MSELVQRIGKLNLSESSVLAFEVNARGRSHPEGSVQANKHVVDDAIRYSLGRPIALELAAVITVKPVLRAHPQIPDSVLGEAGDVRVSETLNVLAKAVPLGRQRHTKPAEQRGCNCRAP